MKLSLENRFISVFFILICNIALRYKIFILAYSLPTPCPTMFPQPLLPTVPVSRVVIVAVVVIGCGALFRSLAILISE
jgi:hypothetical protein